MTEFVVERKNDNTIFLEHPVPCNYVCFKAHYLTLLNTFYRQYFFSILLAHCYSLLESIKNSNCRTCKRIPKVCVCPVCDWFAVSLEQVQFIRGSLALSPKMSHNSIQWLGLKGKENFNDKCDIF